MHPLNLLQHLLSFVAPALAVALLVTAAGRWILPRNSVRPGWRTLFLVNFLAGLAVLVAGLWYFGRDGKMATYAALAVAVASAHFLVGRGWRR